eukprot:8219127-Alexandrium_andersonii.AAC.1
MEGAKQMAEEGSKRQQSWLDTVQGHVLAAVTDNVISEAAPELDEDQGTQFKSAHHDINMKVDIKRELILALRDNNDLHEQETHDKFLAEEAA